MGGGDCALGMPIERNLSAVASAKEDDLLKLVRVMNEGYNAHLFFAVWAF